MKDTLNIIPRSEAWAGNYEELAVLNNDITQAGHELDEDDAVKVAMKHLLLCPGLDLLRRGEFETLVGAMEMDDDVARRHLRWARASLKLLKSTEAEEGIYDKLLDKRLGQVDACEDQLEDGPTEIEMQTAPLFVSEESRHTGVRSSDQLPGKFTGRDDAAKKKASGTISSQRKQLLIIAQESNIAEALAATGDDKIASIDKKAGK